jgi:hypothetical protein
VPVNRLTVVALLALATSACVADGNRTPIRASTASVSPSAAAATARAKVATPISTSATHAPPCTTGQLSWRVGFGGVASGSNYQNVILTNKTGRTCSVAGHAPVSAHNPTSGQTQAANWVAYDVPELRADSAPTVELAPDHSAFETLIGSDLGAGKVPCGYLSDFRVGAPDSSPSASIPLGLYYCGRMDLTPLLPGTGPSRR